MTLAADTPSSGGCRSECRGRYRDGAGAVGVERDRNARRMTGERLVDGVVDDLIDHVMQAGAVDTVIADIHRKSM